MTIEELLISIAELLRTCGSADRATWLEERLATLRDPECTTDAREHVRGELHGVVLGMGGLMDLDLRPTSSAAYTPASARARLDELADALYEATR